MEKILKKTIINLLWSFQWIYKSIVPLNNGVCRFQPTCSAYAYTAIKKLPLWKALFFVVWRIIRCNPMNKGGYDPVPKISSEEG